MLKTGKEHLEGLRDGRVVYIGGELVEDVTTHPAFRNAARSMAGVYDMKADPANRDLMSFEEDGGRYSMYFLKARDRDDLERRMKAHKAIADFSHGLYGRSMDHVASFVTGLAMKPEVFDKIGPGYGDNLVKHYHYMRDNDIYATYAVLPPAGARNPEFYQNQNLPVPTLRVVDERDDGLVITGLKMLATGGMFTDEIWVGNLLPLAPTQIKESVTCAVPTNSPGLSLWSRKPFERDVANPFDYPLTAHLDEGDAMVMCDDVFVPWERVFVHDNPEMSRNIYVETPSHCYGNHQSNVRYWSKVSLLTGVISKVARSSGIDEIPAVRELLGHVAALEATIGGLVHGQIHGWEAWLEGYATCNRRFMYAALNWCRTANPEIIELLRELTGGSVFQMPADVSVMQNDKLREQFEQYWQTPFMGSLDRMKLFRIAWDLVGSEFAARHQQYEKFYSGASFVVRSHSFREAPWDEFHGTVEKLMSEMEVPGIPAE